MKKTDYREHLLHKLFYHSLAHSNFFTVIVFVHINLLQLYV